MTFPETVIRPLLRAELEQDIAPEAHALARAIVEAHGDAVSAVLFYGSCLRERTTEGILDFYVLVDDYRAYHGRALPAVLNRLLPPTTSLWTLGDGESAIRGKVAVISRDQFARRMNAGSLDTSLWTRFCQPCALVYARDPEMVEWSVETLTRAVIAAGTWAARLGPEQGAPAVYWRALFRHTYGAELRVERAENRGTAVYDTAAARYDRLFAPALAAAGIGFRTLPGGHLRPLCGGRGAVATAWTLRRAVGKTLTVARLVKSSFTFDNGVDYIVWKVERHSGLRLRLSPWQRRHPVLAAPAVLWRLWRSGGIR